MSPIELQPRIILEVERNAKNAGCLCAVPRCDTITKAHFRSLVSRGLPRWRLLPPKSTALILVGAMTLVALEGLAVLFAHLRDA